MATYQTVCELDDLPEGQSRMFCVDGEMIGLFHVSGEVHALENACPHAGASLAHGILEGDAVRCRIHHWRFRLRDGRYLDEDKPQFNARSLPVRVVGGSVQVLL